MTKSEILHTVEALIFASGVPIKRSELYDSLPPEVTKKDINDAIKALDQTYRDPRGIVLLHRPPEQTLHKPRDASVAFKCEALSLL